ncbi:MAG: hypothetical protein U0528_14330 [Anaerolineae bacterium]
MELRIAVRAPLAATQLETLDQAVRALDDALRKWPDGEFRAARQCLGIPPLSASLLPRRS